MAKYLVNVFISSYVGFEVDASNEEEAQSVALENIDHFIINDWDYEVDSIETLDDDE